MVNFRNYNVIDWTTTNYNTHIAQYLKNYRELGMKFGQLTEYNTTNISLEKSYTRYAGKASHRLFY